MENIKIVDAKNQEFIVDEKAFELCQVDKTIHDKDFESKPTTYLKDAFRRFCKNKSSVVAAIIIGILVVLAIFVPFISRYNISSPHIYETFLEPKLFSAGTGFWDGTTVYKDMIYNPATDAPVGYKKNAIVKIININNTSLNDKSEYAHGGVYVFEANKSKKTEGSISYDYFKHAKPLQFKASDKVSLTVNFNTEFETTRNYGGKYRIVFQYGGTEDFYVLKDWSEDYEVFKIDLSEYIASKNLPMATAYIRFDCQSVVSGEKYPALYFDSIVYESSIDPDSIKDKIDEELKKEEPDKELLSQLEKEFDYAEDLANRLHTVSITDPNATKMLDVKSEGYWHSTGSMSVIRTYVTYMSFVYDHYEDQLGVQEDFQIGKTLVEEYISKGWCEYDFTVGPESFKKLSDRCPIDKVEEQIVTTINDKEVTNLICVVQLYKWLGYKSMPKFLFGSDASGFDLLTRAFYSLRTSLIVAIIISVVCFAFGLVWGSVSGYFGGNVDLFMERFCDILGGMPFIVLMTLALIIWGQNLGTFAIATCVTGWMGTAGITRTQFYRFKSREYILSSRTLGSSDIRLIFKHILPNSLGTIVTSSVLKIPGVIFSEATLAYLGLGLKGVNSFGVMLSENQMYLGSHPVLILFPALIISLLMISFNLFGNGLRDALNPSLKGNE